MRYSLVALSLAGAAAALPQISRSGKYLYDPNGNRFSLKGVAYQPQGQLAAQSEANAANGGFPEPSSYSDPLSSAQNCTRDVAYLKELNVNSIRVYSVDSSQNHDECMKTFNDNGIYVMLDVSLPLNGSIDRSSPAWTTNLLNEYTKTIDAFYKYENILGFTIGNEVVNREVNSNAAPFVKAAARDIKAYLTSIGSTALVGYAAVDGDADFRNAMAAYMTCGDDHWLDIYGLNNYEWCGDQNLTESHWDTITSGFSTVPVAMYMSEFGCLYNPPRIWSEVTALFASPVSDVFSGGMAFSYFPTSDGYGMVNFTGSDGQTVQVNDDFNRLAARYKNTSTPTTPAKSAATQGTIACPVENSVFIANQTLPPTPDESVCNCVDQNAYSCRVKPTTADAPTKVGALLDYACNLLGESGSNCNAISGNGTSGVYGSLSMCSPAIKLSYSMSAYYNLNPVDSSCDFAGNATLVQSRPNTAEDAATAAASCLAQIPAGGVFTPTVTGGASATSGATTSASTSKSASASGAATGRYASMMGSAFYGSLFGTVSALLGAGLVIM